MHKTIPNVLFSNNKEKKNKLQHVIVQTKLREHTHRQQAHHDFSMSIYN